MAVDLDSGYLCRQVIKSRTRFSDCTTRKCHKVRGHTGKCVEMPFLIELAESHPKVADKVVRDSIMTTGAAWKSEEAGPNRILRWVMLCTDEELLHYGINMRSLQPQVVNKLREKAATYDSCIEVAMWLTLLVYGMPGAPDCPEHVKEYLEEVFSIQVEKDMTTCVICRDLLPFRLFNEARRGKAAIETCHKDPRIHSADNVGFAHRECNIAQGAKTLDDFYNWIEAILHRAKPELFR